MSKPRSIALSLLLLGVPASGVFAADNRAAGGPVPQSLPAPSSAADPGIAEPDAMPADGDPGRIVGSIDGKPIELGALRSYAKVRLDQQQRVYVQRRKQLDMDYRRAQQQALEEELSRMLTSEVLIREAAKRKMTPLQLTGTVHVPTVTEAQVRERYESRKVDGSPPFEKIAPEIRKSLQDEITARTMESWYATLKTRYHATGRLEALRQPVGTSGPARGPADAPVTIVEFADFQCPFCRRMVPTLAHVLARHPQQVRLVYRHFPLTEIHPEALDAAQASVCADRQGKFWEMHDAVFSDTAELSRASLRAIGERIGLDKEAFETCVRDTDINQQIQADRSEGTSLDVLGTPALFVNGRYLQGSVSEEKLEAVVDEELARIRPPPPAATAAR